MKLLKLGFKKILALGCCLTFTLAMSLNYYASAAILQNILFIPGDSNESKYLISPTTTSATSTVDGQLIRYTDNNNSAIYRLPLNSSATKANLVVTVSQNYVVSSSTDGNTWTVVQKAPGLENAGQCDNGNKTDVVINAMPAVKSGAQYIYFKLSDQTTTNGWGGVLWRVLLTYADYATTVITPATAKVNFTFTPDTNTEKSYIIKDGSSSISAGARMRFCDNTSYILYRLPYDSSKDAFLNMDLSANYVVYLSPDYSNWAKVANEPKGVGVDQIGNENRRVVSLNLSNYKGAKTDFLYLKIADQTTGSGWGAAIWSVGIHYGTNSGLYNPFITTGAVNYTANGANILANSTVVSTSTTTSEIAAPISDSTVASTDSTISTADSSQVSSSETASSSEASVSSAASAAQNTAATQDTNSGSGNKTTPTIIIIIAAVILIGAAATQFIIAENKRRAAAQ